MNQPHPLNVLHRPSEAVHPAFDREGLARARARTIAAVGEIRSRLVAGMTELDARRLALDVFRETGIEKHWHQPYIRFGAGTALTFHEPLQPEYRLRAGDAYYVDLGPVWTDPRSGVEYEGDYGDTFAFGTNPEVEACAAAARSLFSDVQGYWREAGCTGREIYAYLERRSRELGYRLHEKIDGHRVSDFPHQKYTKERLAGVGFSPTPGLWILEIQILEPKGRFGAFFEDILLGPGD